MSKNFKARVNSTFDFDISAEDLAEIDSLKLSNSKHHILSDNKSYNAEMVATDFDKKLTKILTTLTFSMG